MKNTKKYLPGLLFVGLLWTILTLFCWFRAPGEVSESERRKLAQAPELTSQTVLSGRFMSDFEKYTQDQFPLRDTFRRLKSLSVFYGFGQRDNNSIYLEDGFAAKLEYPLKESSVNQAGEKLREIYDLYLKDTGSRAYLAIVPDKSYFLAEENGYLALDYEKMREILTNQVDFAQYVDIWGDLTLDSYYKTDTHWRQEKLLPVAETLAQVMGVQLSAGYQEIVADQPFYGVYYGQSALPLPPEEIRYLTNETLEGCTVWNMETGETTGIYNMDKLRSRDPYEMFLSGASPLLVIENPGAESSRELIVFRDSFGSSLVPLLVEGYSKVTLVDTRYIPAALVGDFVEFTGQDVLFLYSTLILNSSESLK